MKRNIIKWLSILFQSIFIGSIILYIYAMVKYRKHWDTLDIGLRNNINTYLYVAIGAAVLFGIIKLIDFLIKKNRKEVIVEDIAPESIVVQSKEEDSFEKPDNYNITEDVPAYQQDGVIPSGTDAVENKEKIEIPKEKQATCPNCNSIVNKEAYICLNCGILLGDMPDQTKHEKVIYKEVVVKNEELPAKSIFTSVIMMVLIVLIMFVAYDYTRNNGVFFAQEISQAEMKSRFYELAVEVLNNFEQDVNTNTIKLDPNNTYFKLSDLNYASAEYNPNQSFIAISRERTYYVIFNGQGIYKDYSIGATSKKDLSVESVEINKKIDIPDDNKDKFTIGDQFYFKNGF